MTTILGWTIAVCVGVVVIFNAFFMLFSPKAWFRLPGWLRTSGTLTEDKFSAGWGGLQVRVAGALFIAVIAWGALRFGSETAIVRIVPSNVPTISSAVCTGAAIAGGASAGALIGEGVGGFIGGLVGADGGR